MGKGNVVKLHGDDYKDPVHEVLRRIADQVERGEHGDVKVGALVMLGDGELLLFTFGPDASMSEAVLLLQAGSARIVDNVRHGRVG